MRSLSRLAKREPTLRLALQLLEERVNGAVIVETGCVRQTDDWSGAGMSTVVFGQWAEDHGGRLWSVDNDRDHLATAASLTKPWRDAISFHYADSVEFLTDVIGPELEWHRIDLLYLDSFDYPYGELLDIYGGQGDLERAVAALAALTEGQVLERHRDLILPSQRHAARELLAALPHLAERAVVLIDDAQLPGGGKARLARAVLEAFDFECLLDGYQTLWARP